MSGIYTQKNLPAGENTENTENTDLIRIIIIDNKNWEIQWNFNVNFTKTCKN